MRRPGVTQGRATPPLHQASHASPASHPGTGGPPGRSSRRRRASGAWRGLRQAQPDVKRAKPDVEWTRFLWAADLTVCPQPPFCGGAEPVLSLTKGLMVYPNHHPLGQTRTSAAHRTPASHPGTGGPPGRSSRRRRASGAWRGLRQAQPDVKRAKPDVEWTRFLWAADLTVCPQPPFCGGAEPVLSLTKGLMVYPNHHPLGQTRTSAAHRTPASHPGTSGPPGRSSRRRRAFGAWRGLRQAQPDVVRAKPDVERTRFLWAADLTVCPQPPFCGGAEPVLSLTKGLMVYPNHHPLGQTRTSAAHRTEASHPGTGGPPVERTIAPPVRSGP